MQDIVVAVSSFVPPASEAHAITVNIAMAVCMLCRFAVGEGDLITFLNIWRGWEESGCSRKWCYKNFINHRTMLRAADIRNQLQRHVRYLTHPTYSSSLHCHTAELPDSHRTGPFPFCFTLWCLRWRNCSNGISCYDAAAHDAAVASCFLSAWNTHTRSKG